jgi:hypothetical protein
MAGRRETLPAKGPGRPKGVPNRITIELREMVLGALDDLGGKEYLKRIANSEQASSFMSLVGKCLPQAVSVAGDPESPLITRIEVVLVGKDGAS